MTTEYKHERQTWRLTLAAFLFAATLGLGGCGGGGGSSSDDGGGDGGGGDEGPSGDTNVSASDLQGGWAGTIEPTNSDSGKFRQLYVEFDSAGEITRVDLDGSTLTGVTGTFQTKPTDSDQILEYNLDGDTLFLWVDAATDHAALVFEDATIGVIEKGASTSPSYDSADATGSWSGASVYLIMNPDLTEDGFDDVTASYTADGSDVVSTDLTFTATGDAEDCANLDHTLSGFNASYGVYDTATATGGTGDCPGSEVVAADGYVSPDASFMVILGGCEAGADGTGSLDGCSVLVLNKE